MIPLLSTIHYSYTLKTNYSTLSLNFLPAQCAHTDPLYDVIPWSRDVASDPAPWFPLAKNNLPTKVKVFF